MVKSNKVDVMIEFVDISLWAVPLTAQQRVKLSSIIELVRERTARRNTQMLLALGCYEAAVGQAELIKAAIPWRGDPGQAEDHRCRLMQTAGWTLTHFVTLKVSE